MLRLDGEVFLLGTAIAAPYECKSDNNKNCDDLRLISAGSLWRMPAGGGRIVANRGSYSEMRQERKRRRGIEQPNELVTGLYSCPGCAAVLPDDLTERGRP